MKGKKINIGKDRKWGRGNDAITYDLKKVNEQLQTDFFLVKFQDENLPKIHQRHYQKIYSVAYLLLSTEK